MCAAQNAHVFNDSIIELAETLLETDGADQANMALAVAVCNLHHQRG